MAQPIVMPSIGMYTEEGVLTAWMRQAGEQVETGEVIAEITTEKTVFEIPSPASGRLHPIALPGCTLPVEAVMGYILAEGETVAGNSFEQPARTPDHRPALPWQPPSPVGTLPVIASPAARRLAAQNGIDLTQITGGGPGGRIVEADILAKVAGSSVTQRVLRRVPLAGPRKVIADRLRSTLATAASTTLTTEASADILVAARQRLAVLMGRAPSFPALFIKLFAEALRKRPELNATIDGDSIVVFDRVHVGFAAALPGSLVVPVIRDADRKTLAEIDGAVRDLSERAVAGRLTAADVEGGTATITNLGRYGIDGFTPVLNGAQAAILGIGRIAERPVVRHGALAVGHTCILSLTFDHRVADGVPAAELLEDVVRRMNDEQLLMAAGTAKKVEVV